MRKIFAPLLGIASLHALAGAEPETKPEEAHQVPAITEKPASPVPSEAAPPGDVSRQATEFQIIFWIGAPAYARQVASYQMMKDIRNRAKRNT